MPETRHRLDPGRTGQSYERTTQLLQTVSEIQLNYIREKGSWYDDTLQALLDLTDSEYGFIGVIRHDVDGTPWLKTRAITNIAWNEDTRRIYEESLTDGLEFRNLDTLFGETIRTGQVVIANDPALHPSSGGTPDGHPPLNSFVGIPFVLGDDLIGMAGLANRPRGYSAGLVDWLAPFCTTCATLIAAEKKEEARKQAIVAKRQSEDYLQTVIENVPDYILIIGQQGEIRFLNQYEDGYQPDDIVGTTIFDYQPERFHDLVRDAIDRVFQNGESVSYQTIGRGSPDDWRNYQCQLVPLDVKGEAPAALLIATDVTEQRKNEEERSQQFDFLTAIARNTSELIFIKDRDSRLLFVNEATAGLHGTTAQDMIDATDAAFYPPDTVAKMIEDDQRVLSTGQSETFEELLPLESGNHVFLTTKSPWRNASGEIVGIVGISRDITVWQQTQRALKESRERLRAIIEGTPECVKLVASDGTLLDINATGLRMIEAEASQDVIGQSVFDLIADDFRDRFKDFNDRVCSGQQESMKFEIVSLRGTRRWMETHAVPLRFGDDGDIAHLGITRDITSERLAEETIAEQQEKLLHVSRLSSMGQMVAAISHEITQPLAAIANFASACSILLNRPSPDQDKLQEYVDAVGEQSQRAGEILDRVRSFVRRAEPERSRCSLPRIVQDSVRLVETDLRRRQVTVEIEQASEDIPIKADRVQIQQVIVNLISNASEAMADVSPADRNIQIRCRAVGHEAIVEVSDNGPGLTDEMCSRAFEAFITSKDTGMGVGLSICRDIIKSHQGQISAENGPNQGALFRFSLPLMKEPANE